MSAVKLYHDISQARRAVAELIGKGYRAEEIGILAKPQQELEGWANELPSTHVKLAEVGDVVAVGVLAGAVDGGEEAARRLGIPEEAWEYYRLGLVQGGALVTVNVEGERAKAAKEILRSVGVEFHLTPPGRWPNSPGFPQTGHVTETNEQDAKFSGDFRKY